MLEDLVAGEARVCTTNLLSRGGRSAHVLMSGPGCFIQVRPRLKGEPRFGDSRASSVG
jgi:hypothetical protein